MMISKSKSLLFLTLNLASLLLCLETISIVGPTRPLNPQFHTAKVNKR
jgi:hypothetical protein